MNSNTPPTLDLALAPNHLYYGDCFEVMAHWPDASVDTIYGDPPFNSKATYSILWGQGGQDRGRQSAQLAAFTDMWHWGPEAEKRLETLLRPGHPAERVIRAVLTYPGRTGMLSYLTYMAERLTEMKRILKPTGTLYLHCDETANHYLKMLLDCIFGPQNFRGEIVWFKGYRGTPRKNRYQQEHETVLFYTKSGTYTWNDVFGEYRDTDLKRYNKIDEDGNRYALVKRRRANGEIYYGKTYPKGKLQGDVIDVPVLASTSKERLGYPTQKPLALLEMLIKASSNEGDIVLDPFCGCGTTIEAGLQFGRQVVGIDISVFALDVINNVRFAGKYPPLPIKGIPTDFESAERLAQTKPFEFQKWAVWQTGMMPSVKQTNDGGIDGKGILLNKPTVTSGAGDGQALALRDAKSETEGAGAGQARALRDAKSEWTEFAYAQVKGGTSRSYTSDVEAFCHVLNDNNAACGVFITLHPIGKRSRVHATAARLGTITVGNATYPRLQFWSIQEFYAHGTRPNMPPLAAPYKDRTAQTLLNLSH